MDRPYIKPNPVVVAGDMSDDVISDVTILAQKTGVSYDFAWTGTPTGAFTVEVSNTYSIDAQGNVLNAGTWTPVIISPSVSAAGSADNAFVNLEGIEAYAIRLVFTSSSGSGTLNATVCCKVQ